MKFTSIVKNIIMFCLSIITLNSCSKKDSTPAPQPTSSFTWQSTNTTAPSTVVFTNTSTNATSYSWDFGDGNSSIVASPTHIYAVAGTYTAKLVATGSGGTASSSQAITIKAVIPAPVAFFSWQSDDLNSPSTVVFANTSKNATSYSWDFGDGNTSTIASPTHIYTKGGTFTAKLVATGNGGSDSITAAITIITPTQLKVKITDNLGNPLSGANATLYNTLSDYQNKTNAVATTTTDVNGYMYFSAKTSNISTVAYYFYITSGCLDNYHNSANHFSTALVANTVNTYNNIILSSEGQIQVVSTSTNPYEIFLDGNVVFSSVAGGSTHTITEVPAGSHTVRVLQLSGYVISATDESFTVNVTCGNISKVTFP